MLTDAHRQYLGGVTRTMQIIVAAMAAGVIIFFGIVVAIADMQPGPPPDEPRLTYIAIVAAFAALIVAIVFPGIVQRSQRQAILAGKSTPLACANALKSLPEDVRELAPLVNGYQSALIIRSALLEGAAFFCLVAYMLEHNALSLAGAGMMLLFMLFGFPTRSKVEEAIETERTTIEQLRQMGPTDVR
jgi:hypothetical protein